MTKFSKVLLEAIAIKSALVGKIKTQMAGDVSRGILSTDTLDLVNKAWNNLDASRIHLEEGKLEDAIYLFSRGCWNLGEFKGRADLEKANTPSST